MAKDPAFLFYPNDWLGGTLGMTFEEKGAYMELLMMQFNRGHMTSHMIGQTVGQLWDKLEDKFTQDESGLWFNKRLDEEKEKRKSFTTSRRNNITGKNQHSKGGHMTTHMTGHMENENENRNEDIIKDKGGTGEKEKQPKIKYSQFVSMTEVEFLKLVELHGNEFTKQCIEALDNYKGSSGKKYQNDYRAILSWVVEKIKLKNHGKTNGFNLNSKGITTTIPVVGGVKMGKL